MLGIIHLKRSQDSLLGTREFIYRDRNKKGELCFFFFFEKSRSSPFGSFRSEKEGLPQSLLLISNWCTKRGIEMILIDKIVMMMKMAVARWSNSVFVQNNSIILIDKGLWSVCLDRIHWAYLLDPKEPELRDVFLQFQMPNQK